MLAPHQVSQLFLKIDADAGGTVDWCAPATAARARPRTRTQRCAQRGHLLAGALGTRRRLRTAEAVPAPRGQPHRDEFTNYMFLEKAQQAAGEGATETWRLFPQVRAAGG